MIGVLLFAIKNICSSNFYFKGRLWWKEDWIGGANAKIYEFDPEEIIRLISQSTNVLQKYKLYSD